MDISIFLESLHSFRQDAVGTENCNNIEEMQRRTQSYHQTCTPNQQNRLRWAGDEKREMRGERGDEIEMVRGRG